MPRARPERLAAAALVALASLAQADAPAPTARPDWPHARLEVLTTAGSRAFAIDVADTPDRQELGLMDIRMLPEGLGMVFPVEPVRRMQMWMKNTLIPLDMLFIDDSGRIACVRERTTPLSLAIVDCPQPSRFVLEIAGGEARRLGIRTGDKVAYPVDRP